MVSVRSGQGWGSDAGLTLLELMLAAAIMASTLVFILGSIVTLSSTSDLAGDQAAVMAEITTIMEELRAASETDLLTYVPPDRPAGSPELTIQISYTLDGEAGPLVAPWSAAEVGEEPPELPNPLHVQISVAAVSKTGRPFTIQTATMVRR